MNRKPIFDWWEIAFLVIVCTLVYIGIQNPDIINQILDFLTGLVGG